MIIQVSTFNWECWPNIFVEPIWEFHQWHGVKTPYECSARSVGKSFPSSISLLQLLERNCGVFNGLALKTARVFVPWDFQVSRSWASRASRTKSLTIMQCAQQDGDRNRAGLPHLKQANCHCYPSSSPWQTDPLCHNSWDKTSTILPGSCLQLPPIGSNYGCWLCST